MGRSGLKYAVAAAALVVLSASTGAAASGLITGADVKNGSLTGKDVKDGSLSAKELADSPRTWTWTAKYTGDGSTETAQVSSAKTLPRNVEMRAFKVTFSGATDYCVAHGNGDFPSLNTGWIKVEVSEGAGSQVATYRTATDLTPTVHVAARGNAVPTSFFVAGSRTHLAVTARCEDATEQTAVDIPMQDFSVKLTFQTMPVDLGHPHKF